MNSARIIIKNIGPIKNVNFEIKRINVFMGAQSSGKSTIAKIISYCQWAEKRFALDGDFKYNVNENLIDFHKLGKSYFNNSSYIEYVSDFVVFKINFKTNKLIQDSERNPNFNFYERQKNLYIPSERNFVATIPNLGRYNETTDNIMSFVYDWHTSKKEFNSKNKKEILNLDASFYFDESSEDSYLRFKGSNLVLPLNQSSSGLQSIVPLLIVWDYCINTIQKRRSNQSPFEQEYLRRIILEELSPFSDSIKSSNQKKGNKENEFTSEMKKRLKLVNDILKTRDSYKSSSIILEEPEQNLFPITQRDLIYYLLKDLKKNEKNCLTLTTHSPFILYAINNCILGGYLENLISDDEKVDFESHESWINPETVNIFEIDSSNGTIKDIKNETTGTVGSHYFNGIMNDVIGEYQELLSFL